MYRIIIGVFLVLNLYAHCDTIPIVIIQHGMREKPYNDTLKARGELSIIQDTVSAIKYRANSVSVYRSKPGRKRYHRRFYTVLRRKGKWQN